MSGYYDSDNRIGLLWPHEIAMLIVGGLLSAALIPLGHDPIIMIGPVAFLGPASVPQMVMVAVIAIQRYLHGV